MLYEVITPLNHGKGAGNKTNETTEAMGYDAFVVFDCHHGDRGTSLKGRALYEKGIGFSGGGFIDAELHGCDGGMGDACF